MKTSTGIERISAALLAAQKNIGAATKGSDNPFFRSKYADLGSVMEACKAALNNEGITVLQPVQSDSSGDYVETILLHSSGEYISSTMRLVLAKQDMQAYGSAVSYARRYSLQSLVFIPAEDDDGEKAMVRPAKQEVRSTKTELTQSSGGTIQVPAGTLQTISPVLTAPVTTSAPAAEKEVPKARTTFRKPAPAMTPKTESTPSDGSLNF